MPCVLHNKTGAAHGGHPGFVLHGSMRRTFGGGCSVVRRGKGGYFQSIHRKIMAHPLGRHALFSAPGLFTLCACRKAGCFWVLLRIDALYSACYCVAGQAVRLCFARRLQVPKHTGPLWVNAACVCMGHLLCGPPPGAWPAQTRCLQWIAPAKRRYPACVGASRMRFVPSPSKR